jgi:hypothetical protein
VGVIHGLLRIAEDLEEDEEMVSPAQIALQLVDWTDPRRLVDLSKTSTDLESFEEEPSMRNRNIHVDLAIMIMTQMKRGSSNSSPTSPDQSSLSDADDVCRGGTESVVQYAGQVVYHWGSRSG